MKGLTLIQQTVTFASYKPWNLMKKTPWKSLTCWHKLNTVLLKPTENSVFTDYSSFSQFRVIFKEETPPREVEFGYVISSSNVCMCMSANWFGLGLVSGSLNSIATNESQGRRNIVHACTFFFPPLSFFCWKFKSWWVLE